MGSVRSTSGNGIGSDALSSGGVRFFISSSFTFQKNYDKNQSYKNLLYKIRYFGEITMAMIAHNCAEHTVSLVNINQARFET
jgi:hypothetical protein